jgi:hypothetical protein
MCTEAQRLANIRNAQFSTGPKTSRGKQAASANSLKHGRYARKPVVPTVELKDFQDWLAAWLDRHRPDGPDQTHLIEAAALAAWKRDRCQEIEAAAINQRVRHADDQFARDRLARAEGLGARLERLLLDLANRPYDAAYQDADNPAAVVRELISFAEGADWMLLKWQALAEVVDREGRLAVWDLHTAALLLGRSTTEALSDPDLRRLFLACAAAAGDPHGLWDLLRTAHAVGGPRPAYRELSAQIQASEGFPDAATGRAALGELIVEQLDGLTALKAEELDGLAEQDREEALALASFDDSKAGAALRRGCGN